MGDRCQQIYKHFELVDVLHEWGLAPNTAKTCTFGDLPLPGCAGSPAFSATETHPVAVFSASRTSRLW